MGELLTITQQSLNKHLLMENHEFAQSICQRREIYSQVILGLTYKEQQAGGSVGKIICLQKSHRTGIYEQIPRNLENIME